jgi:hypothetical protein
VVAARARAGGAAHGPRAVAEFTDPGVSPPHVQVTPEQIKKAVAEEVEVSKERLLAERYAGWGAAEGPDGGGTAAGRWRIACPEV